ncbi:MAG TPA: rhodanese-like domain-containing protein [Crocinitomicaceae bacterium]|nr:rhodanese-like domain-containing protein [Crocinitomicaceae bacterium]
MKTISLSEANQAIKESKAVIIDVREQKEFTDSNISGSINLPSSKFVIADIDQYRDKSIIIVCQSGNRAKKIYSLLNESGKLDISILELHIEDLRMDQLTRIQKGWLVDRQFRFFIGVLLLIFILGQTYLSPNFILIPIILCTGLIITAIIDKCYMRIGIAMMPWNKGRKN